MHVTAPGGDQRGLVRFRVLLLLACPASWQLETFGSFFIILISCCAISGLSLCMQLSGSGLPRQQMILAVDDQSSLHAPCAPGTSAGWRAHDKQQYCIAVDSFCGSKSWRVDFCHCSAKTQKTLRCKS